MAWIENKLDKFYGYWGKAKTANKFLIFTLVYTFLFILTFLLAYSPFLLQGKSFIWNGDGRGQHYPALIYIGRYFRQIVLALLKGKISIPLFDINIGLGSDVLSTLNYYGFGDPLNLLAVFVPSKNIEYLYNFLAIFRVYLAGLTFSALCIYNRKKFLFSLVGAFVYSFSGYTIFSAVQNPFFINPMIQLPLLIIGVDMVINKKRSLIFILTVFYAALCGFYFLYMMTIALGIYCIVAFFNTYSTHRFREFFQMAGRISASFLLGLGLTAILFVPSIYGLLSGGRLGQTVGRQLLSYGDTYYFSNLLKLIAPPGSWDALSLSAVVLPAIVFLFAVKRKQFRSLRVLCVAAFAFYLLPLGGYAMNGFSYPSQRWTFAFALLLSYVVVEMMPYLLHATNAQKVLYLIAIVIYGICTFSSAEGRTTYYVVGLAFLASFALLTFFLTDITTSKKLSLLKKNYLPMGALLCTLFVIGNVSVNAVYRYASDQAGYVDEFTKYGHETNLIINSVERDAEPYLENMSGRFDSSSFAKNVGMIWHVPVMFSYWSISNSNIAEFWKQLDNRAQAFAFNVWGTDQRTFLISLLSGQYFIEKEDREQYVPFGYSLISSKENGNRIYANEYALPWGYTYDSFINSEEFERMDALQRQEAMLQSIALEKDSELVSKSSINYSFYSIPYTIEKTKNVKWNDHQLEVTKSNGSIELTFDMPSKVEGYVWVKGLDITPSTNGRFYLKMQSGSRTITSSVNSTNYAWYFGREDYLFNIGYSEKKRSTCTITFPQKGTYQLNDIQVYAQPMENYPQQIAELREEPLENTVIGTNHISGTVNLSNNKVLCMSIPYSEGWSAKVDGQPVEILRGNIMFMALPLTKGYHEIEFSYCSPGLMIGGCITIISWCVFIGILLYYRRGKNVSLPANPVLRRRDGLKQK